MTTQARRYAAAERTVQAAMYVLAAVGAYYLLFAHVQRSWVLTWGAVFVALLVARIVLAQEATARKVSP